MTQDFDLAVKVLSQISSHPFYFELLFIMFSGRFQSPAIYPDPLPRLFGT